MPEKRPLTFYYTVFSPWDKSISMDIQAVDGACVTIQHHLTPVRLQIPTPTGEMKHRHYQIYY